MYCIYRQFSNNVLCTDGEFHNILFVTDVPSNFKVKTWTKEKNADKYAARYNKDIAKRWEVKVIEVSTINSLPRKWAQAEAFGH